MKKIKEQLSLDQIEHQDFIAMGLACHALCLIEHVGILNIVINKDGLNQSRLQSYKNPHLIRAALATLVGAKIFGLSKGIYFITDFARRLTKNIGTLMLPFVGYRHLLSKQFELLDKPNSWKDSDIDYPAVALASIEFGLHDLDPILLDIFQTLKPRGTICDLGCGTAEKLVKICKAVNTPGLGIEKNLGVIKESKKFIKNFQKIEIIQSDITKLNGVWEDVEIGMISFVFHDISPNKKGIEFLKSIRKHFPRLRCLVIVDIVSLSESLPTIMPGFDYVHGLQGMTPRNYEETLEVFEKAHFKVINEVRVPNMPNTFVWVIKPT